AFDAGERAVEKLLAEARAELAAEPLCALDYLELRRASDLGPVDAPILNGDGGRLLVAAVFDADSECATRLIDNMALGASEPA
ncbi:MAG: hypothetical protein KDB80_05160, partial [Planctomycetes bacterium]|nr:hypothetical protein [Planctomycetota bacterium]